MPCNVSACIAAAIWSALGVSARVIHHDAMRVYVMASLRTKCTSHAVLFQKQRMMLCVERKANGTPPCLSDQLKLGAITHSDL